MRRVCYLSPVTAFCDRLSQALARGIGKADTKAQLVACASTPPTPRSSPP